MIAMVKGMAAQASITTATAAGWSVKAHFVWGMRQWGQRLARAWICSWQNRQTFANCSCGAESPAMDPSPRLHSGGDRQPLAPQGG
jgi:hypothetical protein